MLGVVAGKGRYISRFGCVRPETSYRDERCPPGKRQHNGSDIGAPHGAPVRAVYWGRVLATYKEGQLSVYGNTILLGFYFPAIGGMLGESGALYAHLSRIDVAEGDRVSQGEVIGALGASGGDMTPHLHLEIFKRIKLGPRGRPHFSKRSPERLDPKRFLELVNMRWADRVWEPRRG